MCIGPLIPLPNLCFDNPMLSSNLTNTLTTASECLTPLVVRTEYTAAEYILFFVANLKSLLQIDKVIHTFYELSL